MAGTNLEQMMAEAGEHRRAGRLKEAESLFRRVLRERPEHPDALVLLGAVLFAQSRCREAGECFERAIELGPPTSELHYNHGLCQHAVGDFERAANSFRRAVALNAENADAHWNLALLLLASGQFEEGWREYRWRWLSNQLPPTPPGIAQPAWTGEALNGRRILVYCEQGFGDCLQFARYVPMLAARGGKVVLAAQPELLGVLRMLPNVEQLVSVKERLPECERFSFLLNLPGYFNTTLKTIPATVPYLFADAAKAKEFSIRWPRDRRLKVGLVWAGRPTHPDDANRSIKLSQLAPLAELANVSLISLQKGPAADEVRDGGIAILDAGRDAGDFEQTAALIANLDLVISVDTAAAHLAGAMGKPVWVLLPFVADWRWMLGRADSPWYPTMRLFRQPAAGDWQTPIRRIAAELGNAAPPA